MVFVSFGVLAPNCFLEGGFRVTEEAGLRQYYLLSCLSPLFVKEFGLSLKGRKQHLQGSR